MKSNFKRKFLILLAVVLTFAVTTVAASAYFSDYELAAGKAIVKLNGQTVIKENVENNIKTISIVNTGDANVFVRVGIYGPKEMEVTFNGADWEKHEDFYYYKHVLPANEKHNQATVSQIEASIDKIPAGQAANAEFDIVVVQECSPEAYDDDGTPIKPDVKPDWSDKWTLAE